MESVAEDRDISDPAATVVVRSHSLTHSLTLFAH